MTLPTAANLYSQGGGTSSTRSLIPVVASYSPSSTNVTGPNGPFQIGQVWVNSQSSSVYVLTAIQASQGTLSATWTSTAQGLGSFPVTPYVVGMSGEAGYQTIQSAINAASAAGGGIVYVQPGVYTENVTMGVNVYLVGLIGNSGNSSQGGTSGDDPIVEIIGNFTLDVTPAQEIPVTVINNIKFYASSGVVFYYVGNINLIESGFLTFNNCHLQAGTGSRYVFKIDGFLNIELISTTIDEETTFSNNLLTFGVTPFLNLSVVDSVILINQQTANILPDSSYIIFTLENTLYGARMDLSSGSSSFYLNGFNLIIDFTGPSPGDPLINYGSNDGSVMIQNCRIINASGALANSPTIDANSKFIYNLCRFENTLVLGSQGRGVYSFCTFQSGSSNADPSITMSSSQNVNFTDCILESTNNPAITGSGSGTLTLGNITFRGNASIANTLTLAYTPATIFGEVRAGADTGGGAGFISFTPSNSTTISSGTGTVKMSSTNNANNAAWIKIYIGTTAYWIPAWTTNSP